MRRSNRVHVIRPGITVWIAVATVILSRGGGTAQELTVARSDITAATLSFEQQMSLIDAVDKYEGLGNAIGNLIVGVIGVGFEAWDIATDDEREFEVKESGLLALSASLLGKGFAGILEYRNAKELLEEFGAIYEEETETFLSTNALLDAAMRPSPLVIINEGRASFGLSWRVPLSP